MKNPLTRLFDYQKFEQNNDLQQVIDSVHARYAARELTVNELEWVNAAGDPNLGLDKKPQEKKKP